MTENEVNKIMKEHEEWLNDDGGHRADLSGAYLRNADLRDAYLSSADLSGAYLRNANLRNANLRDANLRDADLRDAYLRNADLRGAYLSGADLSGANLDFSCLPLWCGSLCVNMDDKQVKQLLYHTLSITKHSNNVSEELKEMLLTEQNVKIAKEFHRAEECSKL